MDSSMGVPVPAPAPAELLPLELALVEESLALGLPASLLRRREAGDMAASAAAT